MRLTLADIDRWDPRAIFAVFQAAMTRADSTDNASVALSETMQLLLFGGDAAEAARSATRHTATILNQHSHTCAAVGKAAQRSADEVASIKARLQRIREAAQEYHLAINDSTGAVYLPSHLAAFPPEQQNTMVDEAEQLSATIRQLLADAETADEDLAAAIRCADGDLSPIQVDAQLSHQPSPLPLPPAADSPPKQVNAWWRALTPEQQDRTKKCFPHDIRNLDGIPIDVRNELNTLVLFEEIDRLNNGWLDARGSWHTEPEKQADLKAVLNTMTGHPENRLILLDTTSNPNKVLAAVGIGDVDDAQRVGFTVGGLNTRVSSNLTDMVRGTRDQRSKAISLRQQAKVSNPDAVAAIAWQGYDAPEGLKSVSHDWRAQAGAVPLNRFIQGLAATTHVADQHIAAFGHSYGSLTTSLALQRGAPVSDVVVYGSPGLELTDAAQLGVPPGHAFYLVGANDSVAQVIPRFRAFGLAPQEVPGMTALSTSTGLALNKEYGDGALHERAYGHNEYTQLGSNGQLRMSGYNMAVVLAGLPDDLILTRAFGPDAIPGGAGPYEWPALTPLQLR